MNFNQKLHQTLFEENTPWQPGVKVRWKSAYRPDFWGGYIQPGDTGTILHTKTIGGQTSATIEWDKIIQSQAGKPTHQITPTNTLDLEIIK
jgi:hypothetical protein